MSSLPSVTSAAAVKAFEKLGFHVARTKGSHKILKKEGHAALLTVPVHSGKNLKPGTLKGLIRAADISADEFVKLLD